MLACRIHAHCSAIVSVRAHICRLERCVDVRYARSGSAIFTGFHSRIRSRSLRSDCHKFVKRTVVTHPGLNIGIIYIYIYISQTRCSVTTRTSTRIRERNGRRCPKFVGRLSAIRRIWTSSESTVRSAIEQERIAGRYYDGINSALSRATLRLHGIAHYARFSPAAPVAISRRAHGRAPREDRDEYRNGEIRRGGLLHAINKVTLCCAWAFIPVIRRNK